MSTTQVPELPGLNCGLCGFPTCDLFATRVHSNPELLKRCLHLNREQTVARPESLDAGPASSSVPQSAHSPFPKLTGTQWHDSLGREFDFVLCHFPEDAGPREIIIPHNPMITREMDIRKGDVLIGRPLGMSCGCPITHCGEVTEVDHRTGVLTWCVTGPLRARNEGCKDIGFYIAEAYEGLIKEARCDIRIGMRYFFQPEMCMLQWRHSGLVNYLNRTGDSLQVRVEGLWIG